MGRKLITDYGFGESMFRECGNEWDASTLYQAAKDQKCRAFKFPLKFFNMTTRRFGASSVADMAHHAKRIMNADLDIPVVLCPDGGVLDGFHRITRALALDKGHVMAYRLKEMPEPDRTGVE